MRFVGFSLIVFGIAFGCYALSMDTTVECDDGSFVNNLGLMTDKLNYLIVSGCLLIAGTILMSIGANSADKAKGKRTYKRISHNEFDSDPCYCTNCGKPYVSNKSVKFCPGCGSKL